MKKRLFALFVATLMVLGVALPIGAEESTTYRLANEGTIIAIPTVSIYDSIDVPNVYVTGANAVKWRISCYDGAEPEVTDPEPEVTDPEPDIPSNGGINVSTQTIIQFWTDICDSVFRWIAYPTFAVFDTNSPVFSVLALIFAGGLMITIFDKIFGIWRK